jgi:precorrin-6B methylase 1
MHLEPWITAGPGLSALQAAYDRLGISVDHTALKSLLLQKAILRRTLTS